MSDKKKCKPKEIHVDKLIVKANKVVILDDDEKRRGEHRKEAPWRDPWDFFFPREEENREERKNRRDERDEHKNEGEEEGERGGWRWI